MRTFEEIARAQAWDAESQRDVLLEFVNTEQDNEALVDFAERVAQAEAEIEGGAEPLPDENALPEPPVVDADGDASAETDL